MKTSKKKDVTNGLIHSFSLLLAWKDALKSKEALRAAM